MPERYLMRNKLSIALLFLSSLAGAQSVEQFLSWADSALANKDYRARAEFYEQVLQQEPGILIHQWELAEAYRLSEQCQAAGKLYNRIASKDLGAKKRYPDARMFQALMEQCDLQPDAALKTWEKVRSSEKKQFGFRALKAQNAIRGIQMMDSLKAAESDYLVERLDEPINSCSSEMCPRLHDGKLYFTTSNTSHLGIHPKAGEFIEVLGIASSERQEDGAWDIPIPVMVEEGSPTGNSAFTQDGLLIFSKVVNGTTGLYYANESGKTTAFKSLNKQGNNTKPMVAEYNGAQTLFFASDRRGGSGGWDLWMCSIDGTTTGTPRPVGAPVNTPGNETCPFYDTADQQLYFTSDFHPGMGGYDLFTSFRLREGFSRPRNMGYPINTEGNEFYPSFYQEDRVGFFSRIPANPGCCEELCCPDVFSFQLAADTIQQDSLAAEVLSGSSEEIQSKLRGLLPIRLYFHNDEPNPRTTQTTTQFTYEETYQAYRQRIPTYVKEQGDDEARMENIQAFFEDEAQANFDKLNKYLDLLQVILEKGDTVEITIRGFASPLAESDYNVNLSLRRISSLQNHLRTYRGGALNQYLNGSAPRGKLIISKAPYGESTSESDVSDQVDDLKNSVYSRGAALERRIELEAIDLFSAKIITDTLKLSQDIGKVLQNMPKDIEFVVKNERTEPLQFTGSKADCGCTNAQVPVEAILPGEEQTVVVRFSGKAPEGPFERKVYLMSESEPKVIELKIEGTILPLR